MFFLFSSSSDEKCYLKSGSYVVGDPRLILSPDVLRRLDNFVDFTMFTINDGTYETPDEDDFFDLILMPMYSEFDFMVSELGEVANSRFGLIGILPIHQCDIDPEVMQDQSLKSFSIDVNEVSLCTFKNGLLCIGDSFKFKYV